MLAVVRRIMSYEMTIAEWIGTALIVLAPYVVIGIVWAATHTAHLSQTHGLDRILSTLSLIVAWPVLLLTDVCAT
jgi:uncharacterized membrane protein SirB2